MTFERNSQTAFQSSCATLPFSPHRRVLVLVFFFYTCYCLWCKEVPHDNISFFALIVNNIEHLVHRIFLYYAAKPDSNKRNSWASWHMPLILLFGRGRNILTSISTWCPYWVPGQPDIHRGGSNPQKTKPNQKPQTTHIQNINPIFFRIELRDKVTYIQ